MSLVFRTSQMRYLIIEVWLISLVPLISELLLHDRKGYGSGAGEDMPV